MSSSRSSKQALKATDAAIGKTSSALRVDVVDLTNGSDHVEDPSEDDGVEIVAVVKVKSGVVAATASTQATLDSPSAESTSSSSSFPIRAKKRRHIFHCGICLEEDLPAVRGYTISNCHHRFCTSCLTKLIQTSSYSSSSISCPGERCPSILSFTDIRYILRYHPNELRQYAERANVALLDAEAANEHSDTRRCPAEHCNYVFVFVPGTGAEGRLYDCPQCHAAFCLQCGANHGKVGPSHRGVSCAERTQQLQTQIQERRKFRQWQHQNNRADERFQQLLKRETSRGQSQPCPHCNTIITKNGGCSHMHCTHCKTDFTWGQKRK